MIDPASEALAVELRPHSPTQWIATYYPMVSTPAGRWADVTWVLHQHLIPSPADPQAPAQWLETTSPDPEHPCYTAHQQCAPELAAGYTTALATYHAETTETTEEPAWLHQAHQQRAGTTVIAPGQLSEWVLDDLRDCHGPP